MIGIKIALNNISGPSLLPETSALVSRMTNKPGPALLSGIDQMIRNLKSDGLWDKLDCLWIFAMDTADQAVLNWKSHRFDCTEVNSPIFTAGKGFKSAGAGSYLNTNFNPANDGENYQLNSASIGIFSHTDLAVAHVDIGAANATNFANIWLYSGGNSYTYVNQTSSSPAGFSSADTEGCYIAVRDSATKISFYKDGNREVEQNVNSGQIPSWPVFICCLNNSGTASYFGNREYGAAFLGGGLTTGEVSLLSGRLREFIIIEGTK